MEGFIPKDIKNVDGWIRDVASSIMAVPVRPRCHYSRPLTNSLCWQASAATFFEVMYTILHSLK